MSGAERASACEGASLAAVPAYAPDASQDLSPRRSLLAIVWQRRWIVLSALLLALTAAITYLWRATPLYESSARVMVQPAGPRILQGEPSIGAAAAAASQTFLYTQADVIMSLDLLASVPDELRRMGRDVAAMPSFQQGSPASFLAGSVVAEVPKRHVEIITIRARSPYPRDACDIANAVVNAFYTYHSREQQSGTREILRLLLGEKTKLDSELAGKRQAKLQFLRSNRMIASAQAPQNPALDRLARLTAALTEAELDTLQAQAAYHATRPVLDDPVKIRQFLETRPFRGDSDTLRREFRELRRRLAVLSGQYLPGFPELGVIQAGLKALAEEIAAEDQRLVRAYVAELEQRLQSSERLEGQLRQTVAAQRAEVLEMNDVTAQYQILEAEISALEKTSDAIDARIRELGVTEQAAPLHIRVVEWARPGVLPVAPDRGRTLFAALAGGLMLGVALALVRDRMDQRLRGAEDVRQVLRLPILGVIPHISASGAAQAGRHAHLEPMSDVAESLRDLRTALYFGAPNTRARTLLITSPQPAEGKSTLAANLAIAMAQAGQRVLLLDADFRRPAQQAIFGVTAAGGLSSLLAGQTPLQQAICASGVPGLDVLPCGPLPANPAEILGGRAFAELLAELSRSYEQVVLDSPPVGPVTDARILSASCEATVLALRAGRSSRGPARHARDMLHTVGANLLGVVVNDVPRRRGIDGYAGANGYAYACGYGHRSAGAGADEPPAPVAPAEAPLRRG